MNQVLRTSHTLVAPFKDYHTTVARLLDEAGLANAIHAVGKPVLLKPNLVSDDAPPITTDVALTQAVITYLREELGDWPLIVGEGTALADQETDQVFKALGYTRLNATLVDLNHQPLKHLTRPDCSRWPEMWLPEVVFDSFLISLPVLKAHSLSKVTLSMKNQLGLAPPSKYQQGGHWKKSAFHERIEEAIFELNRYRCPDFVLLDAKRGMAQAHLWGPEVSPPPMKLAASFDPVAIDALGAKWLGIPWQQVGHIALAHQVLGNAEGPTQLLA